MSAAPLGVAEELLEADRLGDYPHPRHTETLYGQDEAEARFLAAFNSHRLPHAWLITGPRGIGKATLAWRIARFLIAQPLEQDDGLFGEPEAPQTLAVDPAHPVARRIAAGSEGNLMLLRRKWIEKPAPARFKTVIDVESTRDLKRFFAYSAAEKARRVVLIDSVDEMNASAANAVLKVLEEPPLNTVLLLISHAPASLLPTIRSRCSVLPCAPLSEAALTAALREAGAEPPEDTTHRAALSALSEGSVATALQLIDDEGLALYANLVTLFRDLPRLDRPATLAMAAKCGGREAQDRFRLTVRLIDTFLARTARSGALGPPPPGTPPAPEAAPGEAALLARLAPDTTRARAWAELAATLGARARAGAAVNLDAPALITDICLKISEAAADMRL
ncbi:DNA polymerase III subunit delta' [Oceanicola sp. 502str15]|uniref:DNA polymerase III subunit delta' n=1 Tax=Oceanicola sp. 502str15 TaxID=2696061 RepID=UPI0020965042|nr:DNA polymerase III subunit delta' [Oceanicola sp. 502str15]MCO6381475.1 DNA polymerase III subunit delta' [Oceanicola sp. 502str15]